MRVVPVAIPRREALRRLGLLTGGALSASTLSGLLAGCRADPAADGYTFQALGDAERALVETLVDLVVPPTDTPGAREAGVPAFIDQLLAGWMDDAERDRFLAGLADVDARARRAHNRPFVDLDAADQTAILTRLDEEAYPDAPAEAPAPESPPEQAADAAAADASTTGSTDAMQDAAEATVGAPDPAADSAEAAPAEEAPPHFFSVLKELTLAGYYTSEVGATQELRWTPAPGRYDADVPFAEVGRAWA